MAPRDAELVQAADHIVDSVPRRRRRHRRHYGRYRRSDGRKYRRYYSAGAVSKRGRSGRRRTRRCRRRHSRKRKLIERFAVGRRRRRRRRPRRNRGFSLYAWQCARLCLPIFYSVTYFVLLFLCNYGETPSQCLITKGRPSWYISYSEFDIFELVWKATKPGILLLYMWLFIWICILLMNKTIFILCFALLCRCWLKTRAGQGLLLWKAIWKLAKNGQSMSLLQTRKSKW